MKLYEINRELERIEGSMVYSYEANAWVDVETGEIITQEELDKMYMSLSLEKDDILKWIAELAINERADIEALKAEEARLKARRVAIEKSEAKHLRILERECGGEKKDLGIATATYRLSHPLEYPTEKTQDIIDWLKKHRHKECIVTKAPELSKTELTKLIKRGVEVPHVTIADKLNFSLK